MKTRVFALLALGLLAVGGCGKKKEETSIAPPPPRGAASSDELSTLLGAARGLDEGLAPTSVTWTRVIAIDEKHALIAGELVNTTIAIITSDGGATWKSFKADRDAWSSWEVGAEGAIVLAGGGRDGAPTPTSATLQATKLSFAADFDASELTAATPLFPTAKGPVEGILQTDSAVPILLAPGSAALIGGETPKKPFLFYGGKPGSDAVAPLKLPSSEKIIPVPYGRPPMMLSIKGKDLVERAFPAPGKTLDKPLRVASIAGTQNLQAELSVPPACEYAAWSFQRVKQPKGISVLGVSPGKTVGLALPATTSPTTHVGCGADKVVVEIVAPKTGAPSTWASQPDVPTLAVCDLAGKCTTPQNAPFRLWPEQHKQEIFMAATEQGILAVVSQRVGDRWGLYLAQGPGDGSVYERQRPIGEGQGDRGRIELGALVSFGKRALLLLSADVTGQTRRGWFVMVSDDGGTNWAPP